MYCVKRTLLVLIVFASALFAGDSVNIWSIGQKDSDFAEFALPGYEAVDSYNDAFPNDVEFVIGRDESSSWPAVHPGERDSWAGSRKHTFTIRFNLKEKPFPLYALNISLTSAQNQYPPVITVQVNGEQRNRHTIPGPGDTALRNPQAGGRQNHTINFVKDLLRTGDNEIKITTQGSWLIYDAVELSGYTQVPRVTELEASSGNAIYRKDEGESRLINLKFIGGLVLKPLDITLEYAGHKFIRRLTPGFEAMESAQVYLPAGSDEAGEVAISLSGSEAISTTLDISPVRKWEVYLIHQTHLDIGYTDKQENVLREQVSHLRKALDYIDASKDYPAGARFKWHPEGMWAVEEFMRTESAENVQRLIEAARAGDIHIDALYAQAMTGAYSEEELFELVGAAVKFGAEFGVNVDSAIQSDVPGYTWGLAEVLGSCGVKYINVGPNSGHRVGHTFDWADKPFYWLSPSGNYKVLFWMAGKGYSWFHGNPVGHSLLSDEKKIFDYLKELESGAYPYDMVNVRYNIGADNGPPNPALPEAVKQWNEKYVWPRLIISGNSDMMREFEQRYGDTLPVERGDFTPYWEDGMA
ncbi:MAG: polysaccharide lyase family protein, partial [Phycisphaerae bacterium]